MSVDYRRPLLELHYETTLALVARYDDLFVLSVVKHVDDAALMAEPVSWIWRGQPPKTDIISPSSVGIAEMDSSQSLRCPQHIVKEARPKYDAVGTLIGAAFEVRGICFDTVETCSATIADW